MEQVFFLNSSAKVHGDINSAYYILPQGLIKCEPDESVRIKLVYFAATHSWYNIANGRNARFTLKEDTFETAITLTNGNYDANQLAAHIAVNLSANTATGATYTCTWNGITGLFTITASGGIQTIIDLLFNIDLTCKHIFGFDSDSASFAAGVTLISDEIISIGNLKAVFIHTDFAKKFYMDSSTQMASKDLFAIIPNLTSFLGEIIFEDSAGGLDFIEEIDDVKTMDKMHIYIKDSFGNLVGLTDDYIIGFKITVQKNKHTKKQTEILELSQVMNK